MFNWNEWVDDMYTAVDARDVERFMARLDPEAWIRFGNADPVIGHDAIRAAFSEYFDSVAALSHALTGRWHQDDAILLEADVSYTRHDGSKLTLPAVTIYRVAGDTAHRCQIFMDVAPLYASVPMPSLCRAASTPEGR